jgi:hypothetical protein
MVSEQDGIQVYLSNVPVDREAYSLNNVGNFGSGSIVFHNPPEERKMLTIIGDTPRQRAVDYSPYIVPTSDAVNLDTNYQKAQIQENSRQLKRARMAPLEDGIGDTLIPRNKEDRKHSYLGFDGHGNPIARGDFANLVKGMTGEGSTPSGVMISADGTGIQAADSYMVFGSPNGAAHWTPMAKFKPINFPLLYTCLIRGWKTGSNGPRWDRADSADAGGQIKHPYR